MGGGVLTADGHRAEERPSFLEARDCAVDVGSDGWGELRGAHTPKARTLRLSSALRASPGATLDSQRSSSAF